MFSYQRLPKGNYIDESTSPNGKYTVKTYLCNSGATVDWAIRGELTINSIFRKKEIYIGNIGLMNQILFGKIVKL